MNYYLYERDKKDIIFGERSINSWVKSLSALLKIQLEKQSIENFYLTVEMGNLNEDQVRGVFKEILLSFEYLAAINELRAVENKINIRALAITAWYYGIYHSALAMICANKGEAKANTHAKVASEFYTRIAAQKLIMFPFDLCEQSLVKENYEEHINKLKMEWGCLDYKPGTIPISETNFKGCALTYLKSTCDKLREEAEPKIRKEAEAKNRKEAEAEIRKNKKVTALKVDEYKKIRNKSLSERSCSFLNEAFRCRGKANYQDEKYLILGDKKTKHNEWALIDDLIFTLIHFFQMALRYCWKRCGPDKWNILVKDLEEHCLLKYPLDLFEMS
ncbi:MAG: hypothetical protein ACTHJ4_02120 [Candidatus Nucleicultricaceae bacterium]